MIQICELSPSFGLLRASSCAPPASLIRWFPGRGRPSGRASPSRCSYRRPRPARPTSGRRPCSRSQRLAVLCMSRMIFLTTIYLNLLGHLHSFLLPNIEDKFISLSLLLGCTPLLALRPYLSQDSFRDEGGDLDGHSRLDALVGGLAQRHGHQAVVHVHSGGAVLGQSSLW